ncbi:hypothetical protein BKA63DRAFT_37766 [Paraphoma chrysanthemicola]|nr:hypothetical protein BKA63DRAFT_37766 [Paraphoma chrysanthemicola]
MASGVEVAGLVLGSIPLILAGLQFYAEGISITRRYGKYKEEISSLLTELRTENTLYINSINMLLIGVVPQDEMVIFLTDPKGSQWKDPRFDRKLRKRLDTSYESYLETVSQLMATVEKFRDRLRLDSSGKPQFSDSNKFKEHYKRLKFSLSKADYKDLMDRLRQANQSLYRMTVQTSHLAKHQASANTWHQDLPKYQIIKDRAESFHAAISKGWKCTCRADHSISLRLEPRTDDVASDDEDEEDSMRDPFHIILQYDHCHTPGASLAKPWTWEEADVRVRYDPQAKDQTSGLATQPSKGVKFAKAAIPKAVKAALDPQANLKPIQDLCSAIQSLRKPQRDVCFSLLANEIAKQKYGVLLITPTKELPVDTDRWSISSLRTVLQDPQFAQRDRLQLAVTLASSVLQLHETPWLEANWGKDSIHFVNRPGTTSYDQPFVSKRITQSTISPTSSLPSQRSCIIRNQTLYALGIALIELYYRKPMAELHKDSDGLQNTGNELQDLVTEFNTAIRLADELLSEAGAKYSDAVRRCIRCDFDQRASNLQDPKFQRAVYQGVVAQLQENYEYLFQN